MIVVKILKFLLAAENLLSVYRNYFTLTKVWRILGWLRILLYILINIYCFINFVRNYSPSQNKTDMCYYIFSIINSAYVITMGLYNSKKFIILIKYISNTHARFIKDKTYMHNMNYVYKFVIFANILTPVIYLWTQLYVIDDTNFSYIIHHMNIYVFNVRENLEYVVMCSLLCVLSEQIKCITREISEAYSAMLDTSDEEVTQEPDVDLKTLAAVYEDIKLTSDLFNAIFGLQISIELMKKLFLYILFLYKLTSKSIKGLDAPLTIIRIVVIMVTIQIVLFAFCKSAQNVRNSGDKLQRGLAKLLIYSTDNMQKYKVTKDFLRLTRSRPIIIQAFGFGSVDMTLLPKFVMFLATYTITALQFNNVL